MLKPTPGPYKANTFQVIAANGRDVAHTGCLGVRRESFPDQSSQDEDIATAKLLADSRSMLLLLEACQLGIAKIDGHEILFRSMRYAVDEGDWGKAVEVIGYERLEEAVMALEEPEVVDPVAKMEELVSHLNAFPRDEMDPLVAKLLDESINALSKAREKP